jgi:hypothetical protein
MPAKDDKNKKKNTIPKKKPVALKKFKTEVSSLSGVEREEEDTALQVEEVIKQAFMRFYDNVNIKQEKIKDLEHLDHIAEEYLQSYMILGYDFNGEKIVITHADNPHDRDALIEHLRTTLLNIVNKEDSR